MYEVAFSTALEAVASGATRDETRAYLFDHFSRLSQDDIANLLADAYREALLQGIEREDIDASWTA